MLYTHILKTNARNNDFKNLVVFLDAELKERDGPDHEFYNQFNKIESIKHVVLVYENDEVVGCGAFKHFTENTVEIKRMYVLPKYRRKGIAFTILNELQNWAKELNYTKCILETGKQQPEAIALYLKYGFTITANFGVYDNIENSVCFEKYL